jgi:hypothetical protein
MGRSYACPSHIAVQTDGQQRSNTAAMPWPPPMHMVASA